MADTKTLPRDFSFRVPSLPKEVYETLNLIAKHEGCSQRLVVVAGVVALSRLDQHDRQALQQVWEQARELAGERKPAA